MYSNVLIMLKIVLNLSMTHKEIIEVPQENDMIAILQNKLHQQNQQKQLRKKIIKYIC